MDGLAEKILKNQGVLWLAGPCIFSFSGWTEDFQLFACQPDVFCQLCSQFFKRLLTFIANRCNDNWNIFFSFFCLNKYIHLESRISFSPHLSVIVCIGDGKVKQLCRKWKSILWERMLWEFLISPCTVNILKCKEHPNFWILSKSSDNVSTDTEGRHYVFHNDVCSFAVWLHRQFDSDGHYSCLIIFKNISNI